MEFPAESRPLTKEDYKNLTIGDVVYWSRLVNGEPVISHEGHLTYKDSGRFAIKWHRFAIKWHHSGQPLHEYKSYNLESFRLPLPPNEWLDKYELE